MLLRGRSVHIASVAAHEHSGVVCACVLERLPIVLPPQPAWEAEYQVHWTRLTSGRRVCWF